MSEIEKMRRHIERTKMKGVDNYDLGYSEVVEMINMSQDSIDGLFDVVSLAFHYGKAKGYQAANAKRRASV